MQRFNTTLRTMAWMALASAATTSAHAGTDGYFSGGWGVKAKGMAGAAIAFPQDSLAAAHNPAGLAFLSKRYDLSVELFNPIRYYDAEGAPSGPGGFVPGPVKSRLENFLIPSLGAIWPLSDGTVLGLTVFGNGGMNTTWPDSANMGFGTFGGGGAGVNLEQIFLAGTYSKKIDKSTALGGSLIYAFQRFSASGLQPFNPSSQTLSNNGTDTSTGWGVRLGMTSKINERLSVGLTYQPKIQMTHFQKYSGLFADHGNFDIPENYGVGIAYKASEKSTLAIDVKTIRYSDVPSVGNPFSNIGNGLGEPDGPGFGWNDMTVTKIGYQWEPSEGTQYRVGVAYGKQPIQSSEVLFNILAPGVQEWHFTAGLTKQDRHGGEWSAAITYSPEKSVTGPNPLDPNQTITLRMKQFELEIGYGWRF